MDQGRIPRLLAVYLPQFYETEDNNRWWGQGFTDWEAVKTAEAYFPGHDEPRMPAGGNYYDLSRKETMEAQARMALEYGIDGFCFYHYYFKKGKMELELPAENLLKWKDIPMPFCFNWANESWSRSWSRMSGNVWSERYETDAADAGTGVLVEQDYGAYEDWVRHFEYLLPFFEDERYIRVDGKPIFVFHRPEDIRPLREMAACWRKLAERAGLPGLYLMGADVSASDGCMDAVIAYEPGKSLVALSDAGKFTLKNGVGCFAYGDVWENLLNSVPVPGVKTYFCGVSGYDNTPRKGRSGNSLIGGSPSAFQGYLAELIRKSVRHGNEIVFISAWNEWGEGMYLEPDETDGYGYLEAVKNARKDAESAPDGSGDETRGDIAEEWAKLSEKAKKNRHLFNLLDKWLFWEQENKIRLKSFLEEEQIGSVAIYGMASLGKHLLIQLRKENINVSFGIDRAVGQFGSDFRIYRPEERFPDVDAIIITAYDVRSVTENLRRRYQGKIVSLEEILFSIV